MIARSPHIVNNEQTPQEPPLNIHCGFFQRANRVYYQSVTEQGARLCSLKLKHCGEVTTSRNPYVFRERLSSVTTHTCWRN